MSSRDDWYRSTTWSDEDAARFEARLARSRSSWNRAQYLRIQGWTLLQAENPDLWKSGVDLSERVIREYSEGPERSQAASAHDALGDHFVRVGDIERAEREYREALDSYKGTNFSSDTDIKLAELLVRFARYEEALEFLEVPPSKTFFNRELYRINVCLARILFHLGDHQQAPRNARRVLELMETTEPQLPQHPTLGIVPQDDAVRAEMEAIVASCEA